MWKPVLYDCTPRAWAQWLASTEADRGWVQEIVQALVAGEHPPDCHLHAMEVPGDWWYGRRDDSRILFVLRPRTSGAVMQLHFLGGTRFWWR